MGNEVKVPEWDLLMKVTGGDREAARFLGAWNKYVHLIDDLVDGHAQPEEAIRIGRWANEIYSDPYYLRHREVLHPLVQLLTGAYEDSVEYERSEIPWQRAEADVIRHSGAEMVRMVAWLCGGYEHMRKVSLKLREVAYLEHHDREGKPV